MTASHQSGPHYIGPDFIRGEPSAQGAVVLCQKYDLDETAVTSGVGVDAFRIPVDAEILDVTALIVTASDAATTGVIKVTDGTNDIVTGLDAKTAANSLISLENGDGAVADAALMLARSVETLQLVYTENGATSTGRAVIYLWYIQKA